MALDLEKVAQGILEGVDYDIAKEDEDNDNVLRNEIESTLVDLVKDVRTDCE